MSSNRIHSKNKLAVCSNAWREEYSRHKNWPKGQWLKLQKLEDTFSENGFFALHEFYSSFDNKNEEELSNSLNWLKSAANWDTSNVEKWSNWPSIIKGLPHWPLKMQSELLLFYTTKLCLPGPEDYCYIDEIQSHFGSSWNSIQSRLMRELNNSKTTRANECHSKNPWLDYQVLRHELKTSRLMEHSFLEKWGRLRTLRDLPSTWREVLIPLYSQWVEEMAASKMPLYLSGSDWVLSLDRLGIDATNLKQPSFKNKTFLNYGQIPSSWDCTKDPDSSLRRVKYLQDLMLQDNLLLTPQPVEPFWLSSSLIFIHNTCLDFAEAWPLEERLPLTSLFCKSIGPSLRGHPSTMATCNYNLRILLSNWLPEFKHEFDCLGESLSLMGVEFREPKLRAWLIKDELLYTQESLSKESSYFLKILEPIVFVSEMDQELFLDMNSALD